MKSLALTEGRGPTRRSLRPYLYLCLGLCLCLSSLSTGCGSISASSESISKSISSPSTSLSASSSPEDSYKEEVRDFTAAHVQQGGTADVLLREVGKIAQRHGISNWENSEATYRAIGAGLAKAKKNQAEVDAYKVNLTQSATQAGWLQKGYDAAR